ncbi:MAG: hypothetical protein FWG85_00015 [Bacteroidetes bacterium]|nr:hypothetical protein [Bacteroidota bacterium]
MNRKSLISLLQLIGCKIVLVVVVICGSTTIKAFVVTSFPESDFLVIDHTTYQRVMQYPPAVNISIDSTIIGYYYEGGNTYKLTDTSEFMTVILWNVAHKIDASKDFVFSCKVYFGSGRKKNNKLPPKTPNVADGICIIFSDKKNIDSNTIGGKQANIGYVGIDSSIAVELDTERDPPQNEGFEWDASNISCHHISYIRGNSMAALDGIASPMQNNWGSVATGQWYCCNVVWRQHTTGGYVLETYLEEKQSGQMLLRHSKHFSSLSDFIDGLSVDSNCQALINFGVSSSTCMNPNKHQIEFLELQTGNIVFGGDSTRVRILFDNCGFTGTGYSNQINAHCGNITTAYDFDVDTLIVNCSGFRIVCLTEERYSDDWYNFAYFNLHNFNNPEFCYMKNGECIPFYAAEGDTINLYPYIANNPSDKYIDTFYIRMVAMGDTVYFGIRYYNHSILKNYFSAATNLKDNMEINDDTLNLTLVPDSLEQSIKLPLLDSCEYVISGIDSSMFTAAGVPKIVGLPDSAVLSFQFLDTCGISTSLEISLDCPCIDPLHIAIKTPECDDCGYVVFLPTINFSQSLPDHIDDIDTAYYNCLNPFSSKYNIINTQVNILENNDNLEIEDISDRICIKFECPPLVWLPTGEPYEIATYSIRLEVCLTIDAEPVKECCMNTKFTFSCYNLLKEGGVVNPDGCDKTVAVYYELYDIPPVPMPLHIAIYDKFGYKKKDVMSEVPTKLSDTLYADVRLLPPDDYYIAILMGSQFDVVPFTIEGIIKSAAVVPNPTSGIASVDYELNCLPSEPMRVTINDIITGNELIELHNGFVQTLSDSIPIDITSLIAGRYLLVMEVNGDVFEFPFILNIIKE